VVVTFVQEGALNALGPIEFYPLNVEATALRTTSSKVVVWAPRLWLAGRLVQWLSTKLRRPLYPIWSFEIGSQAMRGRVLSSARRVEYASGRVIPGSAVAFVSHLSVNIFAWLLSMLVLAGIGIVVGIVATKLAERI
jgi:hypothetical protein